MSSIRGLTRIPYAFERTLVGMISDLVTCRTEGPTSTIRQGTTMTIEASALQIALAPNLFEANECINLPQVPEAIEPARLACFSVFRSGCAQQHEDLIWACIAHAWKHILSHLPSSTCWLCACICGEDTRTTRCRGLWKVLRSDRQDGPEPGSHRAESL
jgi:hypothetical protein